ncbi:MAG: ABC transporter permease [Acidobacteria bacterium]|nr:MAG: ABC transporter permease [Acidobacteriota bacterium]
MKYVFALLEKELRYYFVSPIAYVVLTVFLIISGYFFYNILTIFIERSMFASLQSQQFGGPPPSIDVPALVSRNFFGVLSTVILFMLPMITMATFADEKRRGTMELLMTSPVTNLQVILGKFFASLIFFLVMLLPTLLYQIFILLYSSPRMAFGPIFSGYLGLLLLGGALIALGIFISTLTENQIVAASVTFGAFLILWVIDLSARSGGTRLQEVLSYLSILNHFEDFSKGVIDTSSLVIYASFIFLGLFLTFRSIESLRWRQ